ncbi:Uncharacterized protein At1g76070 [Linum perenne]
MEKHHPHKPKNSGHQVLKFLKAASSINFNNPPFSPTRDSNNHTDQRSQNYPHNHRSGFSGPLLPRVPRAVRGKFKSGEAPPEEPTSPTISCIGQIKHKTKKKTTSSSVPKPDSKENKKKTTTTKEKRDKNDPKKQGAGSSSPRIWNIFGAGSFKLGPSSAPSRRKRSSSTSEALAGLYVSDNEGAAVEQPLPDRAPGLSNMRRFASGHRPDGLGNFDWTAHQIAPVESECRDYSDDEEENRGGYSDDDTDADEVVVAFPARIGEVEGMSLKPRKEVNLWKRRTMDPPRPLQLVGSSTVRPNS